MRTKYPYFRHSDISLHVTPFGGMAFDITKVKERIAKFYTMPHYVESTIESILNSVEVVHVEDVAKVHEIVTEKLFMLNQRLVPLMRVNAMRVSDAMDVITILDGVTPDHITIKFARQVNSDKRDAPVFTLEAIDITNVLREYEKIGFVLTEELNDELASVIYEMTSAIVSDLSLTDVTDDDILNSIIESIGRLIIDTISMKMTEYYSILVYNSMLDTSVPTLFIKLDGRKITLEREHAALLFEACGVEAIDAKTKQLTDDANKTMDTIERCVQEYIDLVDDDSLHRVNIVSMNIVAINAIKYIVDSELPLSIAHEIQRFPDPIVPMEFVMNILMDSMIQMMTFDSVCLDLQSETGGKRADVLDHVDFILDEVKLTFKTLNDKNVDIIRTFRGVWHTYIDCFLKKVETIKEELAPKPPKGTVFKITSTGHSFGPLTEK